MKKKIIYIYILSNIQFLGAKSNSFKWLKIYYHLREIISINNPQYNIIG